MHLVGVGKWEGVFDHIGDLSVVDFGEGLREEGLRVLDYGQIPPLDVWDGVVLFDLGCISVPSW